MSTEGNPAHQGQLQKEIQRTWSDLEEAKKSGKSAANLLAAFIPLTTFITLLKLSAPGELDLTGLPPSTSAASSQGPNRGSAVRGGNRGRAGAWGERWSRVVEQHRLMRRPRIERRI